MGWACQNNEPQFFSCTLNTDDGWMTDRAADQSKKQDMKDLMPQDRFDALWQSMNDSQMEGRAYAKNCYDSLMSDNTQGVSNTYALFLKKLGKKGYIFEEKSER